MLRDIRLYKYQLGRKYPISHDYITLHDDTVHVLLELETIVVYDVVKYHFEKFSQLLSYGVRVFTAINRLDQDAICIENSHLVETMHQTRLSWPKFDLTLLMNT